MEFDDFYSEDLRKQQYKAAGIDADVLDYCDAVC